MPPTSADIESVIPEELALRREDKVILFADVVESVRLTHLDDEIFVKRWALIYRHLVNLLDPEAGENLVKSTGDGALVELASAARAVEIAFEVLKFADEINSSLLEDEKILFRFGAASGNIIHLNDDVFGHDVNVAARLMGLASAGEVVATSSVRYQISAEVDAEIEDLGECYLRHVKDPVRAFKLSRIGPPQHCPMRVSYERLKPAVAVMPLVPRSKNPKEAPTGDALADELIRLLSRNADIDVVSRFSTIAFMTRLEDLSAIRDKLDVDYVVSGTFNIEGEGAELEFEIIDAKSSLIIWSYSFRISDIERPTQRADIINEVSFNIILHITRQETRSVKNRPAQSLKAHTLLIGATNLMRRLSFDDMMLARKVLDVLLDRTPREPLVLAQDAEWRVMRAQQGWSDHFARDARLASDAAAKAVDEDPDCSTALMVQGVVQAHFLQRPDIAERLYDAAISIDNSNALAWLSRGALYAFTDRGEQAIEETSRAIGLSPLDPSSFLFLSIAATAHLTAGNDLSALDLVNRSLRLNRLHASSLRVKAVALWRLGHESEARNAISELLDLDPQFSITKYLNHAPSADYHIGREIAKILSEAGAPS